LSGNRFIKQKKLLNQDIFKDFLINSPQLSYIPYL